MIDYKKYETSFGMKMDFNWHYVADPGDILFFMKSGIAHEAFVFG